MAVRASMTDLIARTRRLIGDTGASATFSDQEIQDALDERRFVAWRVPLRPEPTLAPATQYLTYQATWGDWEADVVLQNGASATLIPSASDLIAGRWSFAADTPPPVIATGATYDRYAAASDLLEQWAAKVKLCVTVSANNKRIELGQQVIALLDLAARYMGKARPAPARQVRADLPEDLDQIRDETGVTQLLGDLRTQHY